MRAESTERNREESDVQAAIETKTATGNEAAEIVNGTNLSLADVVAWICAERGCERLFRRFPRLNPDDLRDAVERAAASGLTNSMREDGTATGATRPARTSDRP